ncbi:MAG: NADPH-dependent 2,4-dienoyl-CoA reductase/sulfur reductase-like enzyme [Planctomycetota bacterium]|jgi:NADPH-dependent 2,4-dienoyl-CoA reductase/sulfur reductase-like enzyme
MSAAIAAAESGLSVLLIDENPSTGGQIYRKTWAEATGGDEASPDEALHGGGRLRARLRELADRIEVLTDTRVWGIFDGTRVAISGPAGWETIHAERLVLAPGAHEFVPPFPGWTLPGVQTPGAAQTMVKSMGVLPGKRALVAGTGPFLLVVANALHEAGVEVVAVVDSVRRGEVLRALPAMMGQPGLLLDGWRYLRQLKRARIPVITGHVVTEARGADEIEHATIAACDRSWRPDLERQRDFEVDTLCVSYGFVPRMQLASLAGCKLHHVDELGGWLPETAEYGRTTVPGVWCAGDGAGVAGVIVAEAEGQLAGLDAARDAGVLSDAEFQRRSRGARRSLKGMGRFRAALDGLSRMRPGLSTLAQPDTVVCRCEELTQSEVQTAVDAGCTRMRDLKVATRLCMGPCQGRMCWPSVSRGIANSTGIPIEELGPTSVRPPLGGVTLGDLAQEGAPVKRRFEG